MDFSFKQRVGSRLTLTVMMLLPGTLFALEPATPLARLARQVWTVENGLPQNTVPYLLQSRNGYLWVGTEIGLARFDGTTFQSFDHATASAFPDAEIRCLLDATDSGQGKGYLSESLWAGTADGVVRWQDGSPTLFTSRDGLPGNSIQAMAQTSDGTVWASTEQGLAFWDGKRFAPLPPGPGTRPGSITSLAADSSGNLWLGTTLGIFAVHHSRWLSGAEVGITSSTGSSLVTSAGNGDVLIANGDGVFLQHTGRIIPVFEKSVLPADGVSFLSRLAGGAIAVASKSMVLVAQSGKDQPGSERDRVAQRFAVAQQLPGSRIESLYPDREGNLWVGTNHGTGRITTRRKDTLDGEKFAVQLFPASDPLASSAAISFLEDREGDLWVGTESAGLQILRDARFQTVGAREGLSSDATTAIVQDAQDALWVGTRDGGLNRIDAKKYDAAGTSPDVAGSALTTANGLVSNVVLALAASPNRDVWVGTPDGLNRIVLSNGARAITTLTSADGLPDDFIRSLLAADDGSLWIGTRRGLTHLDHGRFQTFTELNGLGSDLVGAMVRTPDGDLWIATLKGLSRMHDGAIHNYTTKDGLSSNVITALDVTPDGMLWVGTQNDGLSLWDPHGTGGHVVALRSPETAANSSPGASDTRVSELPAGIHALLHDDSGHLWIASNSGLTRVDLSRLLTCEQGGSCFLNAIHFTTADGLRSRETSNNSHPTACRSRDGRLWFTTPKGLIVVDPLHFGEMPVPPPVVIEHFSVDDLAMDEGTAESFRIPSGRLRFQFDFAGLSFAAPQKLRYEYMLEGFDHAWTYAGIRRTAYYTNIPPGQYRFRVRATLGDAGFTDALQSTSGAPASRMGSAEPQIFPEADLTFELLPHFYQTIWFRTLLLLAIVALVILIFRRRLLRVRREYSAVMAERNRIAREIHDTLAQGYVGISLQLEVLGELLRHNRADTAASHLALTQTLVREGLDDARQSIWALRSQDAGEHTLPVRMRRLVEKAQAADLSADMAVHGAYRSLNTETEQEILRIAQEAIQNIKRHAEASHLTVVMEYGERTLTVRVTDDGRGFTPNTASTGPPMKGQKAMLGDNGNSGHFGLTGMRERAALIQAELTVTSSPGEGTTVSLRVTTSDASVRGRTTMAHTDVSKFTIEDTEPPYPANSKQGPPDASLETTDREDTIIKEQS